MLEYFPILLNKKWHIPPRCQIRQREERERREKKPKNSLGALFLATVLFFQFFWKPATATAPANQAEPRQATALLKADRQGGCLKGA